MGLCPSICDKDPLPQDSRASHIIPGDYFEKRLQPSEKNDDKFFYIQNEENIDLTISRLDEVPFMYESNAVLLEQTLAELKKMKMKFESTTFHESVQGYFGQHVDEAEEKLEVSQSKILREENSENTHKKTILRKKSNSFVDSKNTITSRKKDIKNGHLTIEIQKAKFLHSKLIKKQKLTAPYVVSKLYLNKSGRINAQTLYSLQEISCNETLKNESSITPEWAEVFEHNFENEENLLYYVIGISLYYLNEKNDEKLKIGDEQYFSVGSLIDQKVQEKEIDFKQQTSKGTIAKLRVRFQFIYELDVVKERLLREVRARIEKLTRIRFKHGNLGRPSYSKQNPLTPRKFTSRPSRVDSIISQSSNHDDDNNYFVED